MSTISSTTSTSHLHWPISDLWLLSGTANCFEANVFSVVSQPPWLVLAGGHLGLAPAGFPSTATDTATEMPRRGWHLVAVAQAVEAEQQREKSQQAKAVGPIWRYLG